MSKTDHRFNQWATMLTDLQPSVQIDALQQVRQWIESVGNALDSPATQAGPETGDGAQEPAARLQQAVADMARTASEATVRSEALLTLSRWRKLDERNRAAVLIGLDDPDEVVRLAAVQVLGEQLASDQLDRLLQTAQKDVSERVRAHAVSALSLIQREQGTEQRISFGAVRTRGEAPSPIAGRVRGALSQLAETDRSAYVRFMARQSSQGEPEFDQGGADA